MARKTSQQAAPSNKRNIEEVYTRVPNLTIPHNRLLLRLISAYIATTCWRVKWHKSLQHTMHRIAGRDNNRIKIIEISHRAASQKIQKPRPAIVYYHGGGFFMTYSGLHLENAQEYALATDASVFMVDYRLSCKAPYPAALNDSYDALLWIHKNAKELGVNPNNIAVAGDSAGGALAALVSQIARDNASVPIKSQLLIYPVIDCECKTHSATKFIDTPLWNAIGNQTMWDVYLEGSGYKKGGKPPAYASAIHCNNLKDLPPAYIESAEHDPLHDEAHNYAKALEESGVAVELSETKGTIHGYDFFKESPTTQKYFAKRIESFKSFVRYE